MFLWHLKLLDTWHSSNQGEVLQSLSNMCLRQSYHEKWHALETMERVKLRARSTSSTYESAAHESQSTWLLGELDF